MNTIHRILACLAIAVMLAPNSGCFLFFPIPALTASDTSVTTPFETDITVDLLSLITLNSLALDEITITQPSNGTATLNADNTVTYSPNPLFCGDDSFTYTVKAGTAANPSLVFSDTATVNVTVEPQAPVAGNNPPIANDDAYTNPTGPLTVVADNDTDPDGDALLIAFVTQQGANGTATVVNGDELDYQLNDPLFVGTDSLQYKITDGNGGTDTATVDLTFESFSNSALSFVNNSASQATFTFDTPEGTQTVVVEAFETEGPTSYVLGARGSATADIDINVMAGADDITETCTFTDGDTFLVIYDGTASTLTCTP